MKKRLTCLLLCFVMLLSLVLASCSEKTNEQAAEDISSTASEAATTLTMWVVSEEEVSTAAANAVSKAINSITNSKFKTKLVLHFYTEEEYRDKLEETILAYEASGGQQIPSTPENGESTETGDTTPVTDETETNEFGLTVIKYPDPIANQVDIIYIAGEDMYIDFIDKGWLAELDNELSSSSKKIKEYVSTTLMAAAKYNGSTYAVPNNRVIGDYTYMLLNKELIQKYSQEGYVQYGQIDGFFNENLYLYLQTIYEIESQLNPNVVPIDYTYDKCLELLAHYWSFDTETYDKVNEFSIFGSHYKDMESLSRGSVTLGFGSLFEDADFANAFIQLNKYKYGTNGMGSYFGDATGKTAAVKFITGDSTVLTYNETEGAYEYVETVGDKTVAYYPIVVKYPTASADDIYGNMFGVCSYTQSLVRSMEIVTYLNTNSDFRNLLQYGIEGTHYEVETDTDGNKTVKRLSNEYLMDIYATGNVFIAYPEPEMSADIWENGKVQNRYSLVEPLLGFDFAEYAATTGTAPEEEKIPREGYLVSYTSGYSKDVLGQDEMLAQWISESDAAGKGVYIYATETSDAQNRTIYYYVYNNDTTKAVKFGVEDIREVETQTDEKGNSIEVQTNLDFIFSYANQNKASKNGYELSLVKLQTRKNNDFEIKVRVGNSLVTPVFKEKTDGIIDFDFFNTDEYQIELYEKLIRTAVEKNEMLKNWLMDCRSNKNGTLFVMEYAEEKGDKKELTYVIYRKALEYVTTIQTVPTGDNGELNLIFDFVDNGVDKNGNNEEDRYLFYYIRVTVDKDTEVSYSISHNGKTETNAIVTTAEKDPNFTILGNLDTELIKYLSGLNDALLEKLNACQSYEEVVALVKEMQTLLVTTGEIPSSRKFVVLQDFLDPNGTYSISKIVEYLKESVATTTEKKFDAEGSELVSDFGEFYVYYDSPNTIYHKWLAQYGYKPAEKK